MTQIDGKLDKKGIKVNYLLYLSDRMKTNQKFPLLLFLHGVDQRGDDVEFIRHFALPQILESKTDFPFIVVSPQCPGHSSWDKETNAIITLLDEINSIYPVDPKGCTLQV
ncbi:hypothetical protein [Paenibacillus sp. N3.4]|uniref:hypothetical protein n=1 Tax=Paenibacillus sp. N3.4 TaxID=2603222 RepID=UPI0021C26C9F|nr:hypothetical protein [Paenibacillus sp. N3.4]